MKANIMLPSDMSVCVWRTNMEDCLSRPYEMHTEFVFGVDFNLFRPGQIASCSWVSSRETATEKANWRIC